MCPDINMIELMEVQVRVGCERLEEWAPGPRADQKLDVSFSRPRLQTRCHVLVTHMATFILIKAVNQEKHRMVKFDYLACIYSFPKSWNLWAV